MIDCQFNLNRQPLTYFRMGASEFHAFSGMGEYINRPEYECLPNFGPIPRGHYYVFDRQSGGLLSSLRDEGKEVWFALYPIDEKIDDETYCDRVIRGQFRLHPKGPLGISQGCITIENWIDFQVVKHFFQCTQTEVIPETGLECYGKVRVW